MKQKNREEVAGAIGCLESLYEKLGYEIIKETIEKLKIVLIEESCEK